MAHKSNSWQSHVCYIARRHAMQCNKVWNPTACSTQSPPSCSLSLSITSDLLSTAQLCTAVQSTLQTLSLHYIIVLYPLADSTSSWSYTPL